MGIWTENLRETFHDVLEVTSNVACLFRDHEYWECEEGASEKYHVHHEKEARQSLSDGMQREVVEVANETQIVDEREEGEKVNVRGDGDARVGKETENRLFSYDHLYLEVVHDDQGFDYVCRADPCLPGGVQVEVAFCPFASSLPLAPFSFGPLHVSSNDPFPFFLLPTFPSALASELVRLPFVYPFPRVPLLVFSSVLPVSLCQKHLPRSSPFSCPKRAPYDQVHPSSLQQFHAYPKA